MFYIRMCETMEECFPFSTHTHIYMLEYDLFAHLKIWNRFVFNSNGSNYLEWRVLFHREIFLFISYQVFSSNFDFTVHASIQHKREKK